MRIFQDLRNKLAAASLARRLRDSSKDAEAQRQCLSWLLHGFAQSNRGKKHRITEGMSREEFRRQVPPMNEQSLAPLVYQLEHMEPNVLWPGRAGKVVRKASFPWEPDIIYPITEDFTRHFRSTWRHALLAATLHEAPVSLVREPSVCIGLEDTLSDADPFRINSLFGLLNTLDTETGGLSTCPPPPISNPDSRLEDFFQRNPLRHQMLLNDPIWLASQLNHALKTGVNGPELGTKSPFANIRWVITTSPALAPLQDSVRRILENHTATHEIFASEAGVFAAQDLPGSQGLRLLTGSGIYFEFIPLEAYLKNPVENIGTQVCDITEVQLRQAYVMLISTPAGLCRHDTGEIVQFTSTQPLRIESCGRTAFVMNCVGEKLTERCFSESLHACCSKQDWSIVHFHVAPVEVIQTTGRMRGWHEWWIELKPGTKHTPTGPALAAMLDSDMMGRDTTYARLRSAGQLESPVVRLVIPGIFERWMREIGCRAGTHRPPRCMPDRRFADALAALARFSD